MNRSTTRVSITLAVILAILAVGAILTFKERERPEHQPLLGMLSVLVAATQQPIGQAKVTLKEAGAPWMNAHHVTVAPWGDKTLVRLADVSARDCEGFQGWATAHRSDLGEVIVLAHGSVVDPAGYADMDCAIPTQMGPLVLTLKPRRSS